MRLLLQNYFVRVRKNFIRVKIFLILMMIWQNYTTLYCFLLILAFVLILRMRIASSPLVCRLTVSLIVNNMSSWTVCANRPMLLLINTRTKFSIRIYNMLKILVGRLLVILWIFCFKISVFSFRNWGRCKFLLSRLINSFSNQVIWIYWVRWQKPQIFALATWVMGCNFILFTCESLARLKVIIQSWLHVLVRVTIWAHASF